MSYGYVYVARIAMGYNRIQTIKALLEAEAYDGPSIIIAYSHCIAHGIDMAKGMDQQKAAVTCGDVAAVPLQSRARRTKGRTPSPWTAGSLRRTSPSTCTTRSGTGRSSRRSPNGRRHFSRRLGRTSRTSTTSTSTWRTGRSDPQNWRRPPGFGLPSRVRFRTRRFCRQLRRTGS